MNRLVRKLTLGAILALLPLSANALGISIVSVQSSGGNATFLNAGDILTVDLVVENSTNLDIYSAGLVATGYDLDNDGLANEGLSFVGGASTDALFSTQTFPGPVSVGGLGNIQVGPVERQVAVLDETFLGVQLFESASITPSNGNGSLDVGIGGGLVGEGDVHFQIQFAAGAISTSTDFQLVFGASNELGAGVVGTGGAVLPVSNSGLTVMVVPEPGTVVLMGLGLMGLASAGRGRSHASVAPTA